MKNNIQHLVSIAALILVIPFILSKTLPINDVNDQYKIRGEFNPDLLELSSIELLEKRLSDVSINNTKTWVECLDSLLRFRFYHGTCRYNFNENWLAFSLGLIFWDDLRMIADPELILQKKVAVCNQVNIVFQTILLKNKVKYRTVGLKHHLATEVFYNNQWHYYDADYEPKFEKRPSAEELIGNTELFKAIYSKTEGAAFNPHFEEILSTKKPTYYKENQQLAKKLKAFQSLCSIISEYGWVVLLLFTVFLKYI